MTEYVPSFKYELEEYKRFDKDIELPYLKLLQDLVNGKIEGPGGKTIDILDLTYEGIASYDSEIEDLKREVASYKTYRNDEKALQKKIRGWAREVDKKIDTTLTRAYGTLLIRKIDMINLAKETAPQTDRAQQELFDKMREQRAKQISELPSLLKLLDKYKIV